VRSVTLVFIIHPFQFERFVPANAFLAARLSNGWPGQKCCPSHFALNHHDQAHNSL
jgi:hypothetical protein